MSRGTTRTSGRIRRVGALLLALGILVGALTGCSGSSKQDGKPTSVFDVKPGDCFIAPKDVKAELANLNKIDCSQPHTQESYAILAYKNADGTDASVYPGADLLTKFAQGKCAQSFETYVGVSYLDSKLFFTYLFPSPRGWEQDHDRNVICFVTTTGQQLTATVKGTKK